LPFGDRGRAQSERGPAGPHVARRDPSPEFAAWHSDDMRRGALQSGPRPRRACGGFAGDPERGGADGDDASLRHLHAYRRTRSGVGLWDEQGASQSRGRMDRPQRLVEFVAATLAGVFTLPGRPAFGSAGCVAPCCKAQPAWRDADRCDSARRPALSASRPTCPIGGRKRARRRLSSLDRLENDRGVFQAQLSRWPHGIRACRAVLLLERRMSSPSSAMMERSRVAPFRAAGRRGGACRRSADCGRSCQTGHLGELACDADSATSRRVTCEGRGHPAPACSAVRGGAWINAWLSRFRQWRRCLCSKVGPRHRR
jgi:hypothetical protein